MAESKAVEVFNILEDLGGGGVATVEAEPTPAPAPTPAPTPASRKPRASRKKVSGKAETPIVENPEAKGYSHTVRPEDLSDYHLYPREPEFVDGYKMSLPGGGVLTIDELWDAYRSGENILLVGPSGSGKSTLAFHLLDRANKAVREKNLEAYEEIRKGGKPKEGFRYLDIPYDVAHYSCHEATRSESLIGSLTLKVNRDGSREPVVVYGAVVDAWVNGKTLILEEMDFAPPGVWGETHQFFDGRTNETIVYINGPEKIRKSPRFRVIATANTLGTGENQIEYAGTQVLNRAFMNRFTYIVHVDYMEKGKEIELIHNRTKLRADIAERMVNAATQSRKAHAEGVIDAVITTRDILSWARECVRAQARQEKSGMAAGNSDAFWAQLVVPAAGPTFLARISDQSTLDTMRTYLGLR